MYKLATLAVVLLAAYASASPSSMRGSSAQYAASDDFEVNDDAPLAPAPVASRLASLQKHYNVKSRLPQSAVLEHEASHLEQENASHDEHTSSGKNHSNRVSSKSRNKVKNINAREKFHNNEEEIKQTPTLFHSKKSNTNYQKSYNKNKREDVADYDQDVNTHSKFVHKKNGSSSKLKKNHVKDANGEHVDSAESYDNNEDEEFAKHY